MNALSTHAPVLLIAVPLLGAFGAPLIAKLGRSARIAFGGLIAALTAGLAGWLAATLYAGGGTPIVYVLGGRLPLPSGLAAPIRIMLEVDGMSAFMALLAALVGALAVLYSVSYAKERSGGPLYDSLLFLLMAGMFGLVLTGDMFNFFVFLEITSIAACGLIGFRTWWKRSAEAAFKVMALYTLSGLLVLLAVGLLYGQYGGLNLAYLAQSITGSMIDRVALALLLAGLAMKAGAVPMHMWAPEAYGEAPAPASMVLVANSQASLYGLFRILFTLYGVTLSVTAIGWILIVLALLTIFVGVTMALVQRDIKRLIAFGAVSQIGYMLLAVGVGFAVLATRPAFGFAAIQGGIFHMINDVACIGLLFLASGVIIRVSGTRDLQSMGGLAHHLKGTTVLFAVGAFALAGVPPFNGFASKLLIYESTFRLSPVLAIIAVLASIILLAVFLRVFQAAFLGPRMATASVARVPWTMTLSMLVLAAVVIGFGLFPGFFVDKIVTPAAHALWDGQSAYIGAVLGGG
jgi:multicomponent Na+:H+ antiporter subunit D